MTPLTRFDTTFCSPKPMPTPMAPPRTAKAVRSIPTLDNAATMAIVTSTIFSSLENRTWIDGVRVGTDLMRRSKTRVANVAAHNRMASDSTPFSTPSAETRRPPTVRASESSTSIVSSSRPTMLSAATDQAQMAMNRAQVGSRITLEVRPMMTQAFSKLATIVTRCAGHPAALATITVTHCSSSQTIGRLCLASA